MADGKTHGFIGCDITGSPYTWSASDIEYLKRIGDMLGNTLQNIYNRKAIHTMQQELIEANRQLQKLANIDGLTGIANSLNSKQSFKNINTRFQTYYYY